MSFPESQPNKTECKGYESPDGSWELSGVMDGMVLIDLAFLLTWKSPGS